MYHHDATLEMAYNSLGGLLKKVGEHLKESRPVETVARLDNAMSHYVMLRKDFLFLIQEVDLLRQMLYKPVEGEKICKARHPKPERIEVFPATEPRHLSETSSYSELGLCLVEIQSLIVDKNSPASGQIEEAIKFHKHLLIEYDGLVEDVRLLREQLSK
jgi:hypothetical protein